MIAFLHIVLWLLADLVGLVALSVTPRRSLEAENLFLRRQLALYRERGIKPRRTHAADRDKGLARAEAVMANIYAFELWRRSRR